MRQLSLPAVNASYLLLVNTSGYHMVRGRGVRQNSKGKAWCGCT